MRPPQPFVRHGLHGFVRVHDARAPGRAAAAVQDQIQSGLETLLQLAGQDKPEPYEIQAVICNVPAQAVRYEATDSARGVALYGQVDDLTPSSDIALNRVVALSLAVGAEAGLIALGAVIRTPRWTNISPIIQLMRIF